MSLRPSPAALASTGLPESALAAIQQVLAAHPAVQQAILYGSRALGRHRPASDIDLTLLGPDLSSTVLARIDAELDDLLLPWVIDLSCHTSLRHPALLDHIERVGLVLYERAGQKLDQRAAQMPPPPPPPPPPPTSSPQTPSSFTPSPPTPLPPGPTPSPPTLQQTLPP